MHKDILAARSEAIKPNPFIALYPLDCAGLLDGGLVGGRIRSSLRPGASGRLLLRGAAVDAEDFGYLRPFGTGTGADIATTVKPARRSVGPRRAQGIGASGYLPLGVTP
jgi:hypothetical protein